MRMRRVRWSAHGSIVESGQVAVLQDLPVRLEAVGHRSADIRNCDPLAASRFAAIRHMKQLTCLAPSRYGPMVEVSVGGVSGRSKMHRTWSD